MKMSNNYNHVCCKLLPLSDYLRFITYIYNFKNHVIRDYYYQQEWLLVYYNLTLKKKKSILWKTKDILSTYS